MENVVRRLEDTDSVKLTEEMRLALPAMIEWWVEHFERKRTEYVSKSKNVNWLDDRTYNIWPEK